MKKILTTLMITFTALSLCLPSAWAGSKRKHLAEGIILGTGAAILGAAVISGMNTNRVLDEGYYAQEHRRLHTYYPPPPRQAPNCRYERIWVSPKFVEHWIPGHYNRRGYWIPGHYQQRKVRDGYWETRRICRR